MESLKFGINLEELSYFLNRLSDQVNDQDKTSDSKESEVLKNALARLNDQASDQAVQIIESKFNDKILAILNVLEEPKKRVEILEHIGLRNHSDSRERYLDPLVKLGWLELTILEKPTHKDQKYKRTIQGELLHKLILR